MRHDGKRPPLVSYVTWNRLGLTARNLAALLDTPDDFELHITDSNSCDNTWEYIESLNDPRIRCKTRLPLNRGPIYAINFNLSKRSEGQYFIAMDSDVNIHTDNWIGIFIEAFEEFPEVGLLGAASREYYDRYRQPYIRHDNGSSCYHEITRGFVEGCMQCFRPELLDILGYWCEECCMGDVEICHRICKYTQYKAGYLPAIEIDQIQQVSCGECSAKNICKLYVNDNSCFKLRNERYRNPQFRELYGWKYQNCIKGLESGIKPVRCASVHDVPLQARILYNRQLTEENFKYYETYSN